MNEQELADFIKRDRWFDSKGHSWILYGICRAYARKLGPIKVLEIGTRAGSSAIPMLAGLTAGNADAKLVSIDNGTDLDQTALTGAKDRIKSLGLDANWEFHFADSRTWQSPHEKYQVIFIDGDHSYEGVKSDFVKFAPLLDTNGVILMHDAEVYPGIRQFLPEIDKEFWMLSVLPFYNGLAIARRRSDWTNIPLGYIEDEKW